MRKLLDLVCLDCDARGMGSVRATPEGRVLTVRAYTAMDWPTEVTGTGRDESLRRAEDRTVNLDQPIGWTGADGTTVGVAGFPGDAIIQMQCRCGHIGRVTVGELFEALRKNRRRLAT